MVRAAQLGRGRAVRERVARRGVSRRAGDGALDESQQRGVLGKFNLTALSKLDELLYLDLSDNLFSGTIPDELFEMTKLQSLVLSSNRLEGLSNKFGRLVNLRHLDISANGLTGTLPKSMGKMRSLEVLYLGESGLER